ncbi:unnamed protein product [Cylicostephanus goldi]|uniref:Uncharacterized protein n=1 Tax=Cylicostephanus goldi TaxID=71465 RepID=A0A3P6RDW8_CYLGO|nr:unnamed protein product [Cylicostephanus goldi]
MAATQTHSRALPAAERFPTLGYGTRSEDNGSCERDIRCNGNTSTEIFETMQTDVYISLAVIQVCI